MQDLYEDVDYGVLSPQTKIKVKVNPTGKLIKTKLLSHIFYYYSVIKKNKNILLLSV